MRGNTDCQTFYIFCADAVQPHSMASILEQSTGNKTSINFNQEVINKTTLGLLTHITLKLTVKNPVTIYSKEYTCTILGDGTEHHWGNDYEEYPPAEVYLRCITAKKIE